MIAEPRAEGRAGDGQGQRAENGSMGHTQKLRNRHIWGTTVRLLLARAWSGSDG